VASPRTLQLRVGCAEPGALRAGAPVPSRDLTESEILENLEHFTIGRDTPRTRPCSRLALSGVSGMELAPRILHRARELGIEQIVLHGRCPSLERGVDAVALRVGAVEAIEASPAAPWIAVVPLDSLGVAALGELVPRLVVAAPRNIVLAWPLPGHGQSLPPLREAILRAREALESLVAAGVPTSIRGLPPCVDGSSDGRTANRFYVDADHQLDEALLFVPDVVQYLKPDSCRSCARSTVCDGVPRDWLEHGVVGPLEPISVRH